VGVFQGGALLRERLIEFLQYINYHKCDIEHDLEYKVRQGLKEEYFRKF